MPRGRKKKKNQILNYDIEKEMEFLNNITFRQGIIKISALFLLVSLNWIGLGQIGQTLSYFSDTENSPENIYSAGTLAMSLRSGQDNFVPKNKSEDLKPGDTIARDIYIKKEGSLPFKYTAFAEPISGSCDQELFDALELKFYYNYYTQEPDYPGHQGHRTMSLKYQGLLKDFDLRVLDANDPHLQIPNNNEYFENIFYGIDEHWFYATEIILPENVSAELQNKSCEFNFVFEAWQTNFEEPNGGFSDTKEILNYVATSDWSPEIEVLYPNDGEIWYAVPTGLAQLGLGQYEIRWSATSPSFEDEDLDIDIWFCKDSGNDCFYKITESGPTENDGSYIWTIPYDTAFVTDEARIKITATDPAGFIGEDMSDADFCPPMLTQFEFREMMRALSIENGFYGDETDDEIIETVEVVEDVEDDKIIEDEEGFEGEKVEEPKDGVEENETKEDKAEEQIEEQEQEDLGNEEEPILEPETDSENAGDDEIIEDEESGEGDAIVETVQDNETEEETESEDVQNIENDEIIAEEPAQEEEPADVEKEFNSEPEKEDDNQEDNQEENEQEND